MDLGKLKVFALCTPEAERLRDDWYLKTLQDEWDVHILSYPSLGRGNGDFKSEVWTKITREKVNVLTREIRANWGEVIIFSDLDIQFFGRCTPIIMASIEGRDMVFMSEDWPFKSQVNSGFIAIRCNERTLEFWETVSRCDFETLEIGEQTAVNEVLAAKRVPGLAWSVFPDEIWARSHYPDPPPRGILVHHANCTGGPDSMLQKVLQLQEIRALVASR